MTAYIRQSSVWQRYPARYKKPLYKKSYPVWHFMGVGQPVMVIENHDGGHYTARHHEHDAVEVGAWR